MPCALLLAAGVLSSVAGHRATRGVRGESSERGAMYMVAWFVAFAGYGILGPRFEEHLPEAEFGLLMGARPVLLATALYLRLRRPGTRAPAPGPPGRSMTGTVPVPELDPVIHAQARLRVVAALATPPRW